MKTSAASKAGRDRRADVGNSGAVKVMKIAAAKAAVESAAGKTGGDGRADVGSSGAAKLMNTAPNALESATGKTGGNGRARVEARRWMYAAYAKAMQAWTTAEGAMQTSGGRSGTCA